MPCWFRHSTIGITKLRALTGKWIEWTTGRTANTLIPPGLRFHPALKHQNSPHLPGAVVVSVEHSLPQLANVFRPEQSVLAKTGFGQGILHPFAKPPAHPPANRNAEPGFGPIHQFARHIPIEQLAQQPLALV